MSSEDFDFKVDFSQAIKQFEALANSQNKNSATVDALVKAVGKYDIALDKIKAANEALSLSNKTLGTSFKTIDLSKQTFQANTYATSLGRIKTEMTEIIKTQEKLNNTTGSRAGGFGDVGSASFGNDRRKYRPTKSATTDIDIDGSGNTLRARYKEQQFGLAQKQIEIDEAADKYYIALRKIRLEKRDALVNAQNAIEQRKEFDQASQGAVDRGISLADTKRLEFLARRAILRNPQQAGLQGPPQIVDDRKTPSATQLTILQSRANTDNQVFDTAKTGRDNQQGIGLVASARYFAVYRGLSFAKELLTDATEAAKKFALAITEIQTITQKSGKSFEDFRKEITAVSNTFGIKIEDVAEGTYQALSNQVTDAAHSFQFLSEAAKFAKVTNSSLTDAVNLGSSALNSYGLSADQANVIFAKLFKGIELGRIRADEIANTFGTVAAVAAPMGVSIDEVVAALAKLTTDGVTAANAMTFLRNLLIKMARPTKDLDDFFGKMGYSSGQAAIATEGFAGVLEKLFKNVDGNIEEAGELFHNIRAIQAEMGLAKKGAFSFAEALDRTKESADSYNKAIKIATQDSSANLLAKQFNEVRNELVNIAVFGIESVNTLIPSINSFKIIVDATILSVGFLTAALIAERVAAIGAAEGTTVFGTALTFIGRHPVILALTAITAGILYAKNAQQSFNEEALKNGAEAATSYANKLNTEMVPALDKITEKYRALGKAIAEQYKVAEATYVTQKALVEQLKDTVIRAFEEETNAYKEQIAKLTALRNQNETAKKNAEEKGAEGRDKQRREEFEKELIGLSDIDKAQKLRTQSQIDQQKALKLAQTGNAKSIEEARKLSTQAVKDAEEADKLNPGDKTSDSIKTNSLLRERRYLERELARENKLANLSGTTGLVAKDNIKGLLNQIDVKNEEIEVERRKARLPGRPDTSETFVQKAKSAQIDLERIFGKAVDDNNAKLSAQEKFYQTLLDITKENRDVFGDWNVEIKKAGSNVDALTKKLLELAHASTGPVAEALSNLASQLGTLGFASANRDTLGKQGAAINNRSQAEQSRLQLTRAQQLEQFNTDKNIVTSIGSLSGRDLQGRGLTDIRDLVRSFKGKIVASEGFANTGQADKAQEALTLTPEERKQALVAFGIAQTNNNKGFGFRDQTVSDDTLKVLKAAADALRTVPESVKQIQKVVNSILFPLSGLKGKDSKANGGYSYTGGIHHPKEFIVNSLAAGKYRTLLEQINNGTESYVSNPGNKGYFDVRAYLRHFANISNTGSISGYEGENGSVNQLSFASGLRKQLESLSGLSFDSYRNGNFDLSPRIYSGFQGKDFGSVGGNPGRSYQFGDINITVAGGANSQVIAEGIRRDISRQLSTLS